MKADLHTHSSLSDGVNNPSEVVRIAKEAGLKALSITDHDTVLGIKEAIASAKQFGIVLVPGIEISTLYNGQDIHILGYYINYNDQRLIKKIEELQKVRAKRNLMMINRLNELGIEITIEDARAKIKSEKGNVGRPHIGEVLIDKGIVTSMEEAFDKYLGKDGLAYINPVRISPEEGINIIKAAGGVAVLAHPGIYDNDELVNQLIAYGLAGIEVYHPDHDKNNEIKYLEIANNYRILATGGSDFHGERKGEIFHAPIGTKTVSYDIVQKLKDLSELY